MKRLILALVALVLVGAIIVTARPSSGAGAAGRYVVRPGDTLWTIAERFYGGDPRDGVWRLRDRNELSSTLLVPGQRLRVPSR